MKGILHQHEKEVAKNELFWKDFPLSVATADQIKQKLQQLGSNANFIDIDFPPLDKSISE